WSSTLNIALGRASETVPSTSMTSLFALPCCLLLLANDAPAFGLRAHAHAEIRGATHGNQNCTETAHRCHDFGPSDARFDTHQAATAALPSGAVRTTGPAAVHRRADVAQALADVRRRDRAAQRLRGRRNELLRDG